MKSAVRLSAIGELLGKDFFIPAYQRGYRWDKQQVVDLLNDIASFAEKPNKKQGEFYCLQPVVVRPRAAGASPTGESIPAEPCWEVVDGQQRLTTLKILFLYLIRVHLRGASFRSEYKRELFNLHYETRATTNSFLENIEEGNEECIDHYYIAQTYTHIREWFEEKDEPGFVRESVLRTLVGTSKQHRAEGIVQVIWYELAATENAIDSFTRINLGKIPLTNAELIKALFLQTRNFGADGGELGRLRQLEIAAEWDRIENTLQNDDLWWFLNKGANNASARIEFIFDLINQLEDRGTTDPAAQIGSDDYATFRFYYRRATGADASRFVQQQWAAVKMRFNQLLEWYQDPEWYHYVGFLIYCGERIEDLVMLYHEATRSAITAALKARIAARLADTSTGRLQWERDAAGAYSLQLPYNDRNRELVHRVLLLFNLQEVIRQRNSSLGFTRFPFKVFKQEMWDIEHIDSSSERPLTNAEDQLKWLAAAQHDLPQLKATPILLQRIQTFEVAKHEQREDFQDIYQAVVELAGEAENDTQTKNGIGNLTLLDARTNRSYGNALFVTKRRRIIENDTAGQFIPPCTKNVFLKYFDLQGVARTSWGVADIRAHSDRIAGALADFLPAKPLN
ncbi:DUF262 domain-containing protein [Hymenobacter coalescens]